MKIKMKNSSLLKRRQIKNYSGSSESDHKPVSLGCLMKDQEKNEEQSDLVNNRMNSMLVDLVSLQAGIQNNNLGNCQFNDLDDEASIKMGGETIEMKASDMEVLSELGRGAYGVVEKMRHKKTNVEIAVKRIVATDNKDEQRRLRMDVDITRRSSDCPHIVHYFGAMYRDGDVWICMEVMDLSLEKFYARAFGSGEARESMPEGILAHIAYSAVSALSYLHDHLHVIHRDVKPSNMLINRDGKVKICDFGVAGYLVDSVAKTIDAGCKPYMAPERVDPQGNPAHYDIRSDVWSLGISLIEIATGKFPYNTWTTMFEQLKQVVFDPAPRLPAGSFSKEICHFTEMCLDKDVSCRANYSDLAEHAFMKKKTSILDIASFVTRVLDCKQNKQCGG